MDYFNYKSGELFAEGVPLTFLAGKYGTPLYVYSQKTLKRHINAVKEVFKGSKTLICFACKANDNSEILGIIKSGGLGADCVSGGELALARRVGIPPAKIVFNGNGKTEDEIILALKMGVKMINIDSVQELFTVSRLAKKMKIRPRVSFRVNPEIKVSTHTRIATGIKKSKFGITCGEAPEAYKLAKKLGAVEASGIHVHIGSQIIDTKPFAEALKKLVSLSKELKKAGIFLKYVNAGGGLGVRYNREFPATLREYSRVILKHAAGIAPHLILEPGRMLVANAGILLTRVVLVKNSGGVKFIVVDCGMNDLLRPTLYDAFHDIVPVCFSDDRKEDFYDIVGPICESGDVFARRRSLREVFAGECLAVKSAGAYGYSMSSNYNLRPRPAEVMVDGGKDRLIRKREKLQDIIGTVPRRFAKRRRR